MDGRLTPIEKITSLPAARRAGVGQSAVSRAFTPGASASAATVEKVRRAAEEPGSRPNVLARSLIAGPTRIIGLLLAYLENQFCPVMLEPASRALQEKGYHVRVFMAGNTTEKVAQVLEELLDYQVDGIISASVAIADDLTARCAASGLPVVRFNRGQDDARLSGVTSDNIAGARRATEFPIAAGHSPSRK